MFGRCALDAKAADARPARADRRLRIATWNVGYAGLGRESDFFADGGRRVRPPSGGAVDKNLTAIVAALRQRPADLHFLQELARPGPLTRGRDVLAAADAALDDHARWFWPDVASLIGPPVGLRHGHAVYARVAVASAAAVPLPRERRGAAAWLGRRYAAVALRAPIEGDAAFWSLIAVHLAAFDPDAATRRAQLTAVMTFAERERAAGGRVVVGGDFNLRLSDSAWPTTTPERCGGAARRLTTDDLPPGWRVAADPTAPTVRSLDRPYAPDQNWRGVIDGFLLGPGVDVEAITAVDLGFEASDHNPVHLIARAV